MTRYQEMTPAQREDIVRTIDELAAASNDAEIIAAWTTLMNELRAHGDDA